MAAAQTGALVAARWLADAVRNRRVGPKLRLLDASWYLPKTKRDAKREFERTRIPGASFFDLDACSERRRPGLEHMMPAERQFERCVSALGIGPRTHVVVYDASEFGSFSAPRVWWMFRAFGHDSVSVLDGGLRNWLKEGHPVTGSEGETEPEPEPGVFTASLDQSRVKSYEDVLNNITGGGGGRAVQLVDARASGRFRGIEPEPRENTEPGHIPGSINMPFTSFLDPATGLERPPQELSQLFQQAGVDLTTPFWVTCGSGVTACHVALAAHLCAQPRVCVYDGAWAEWFSRASPEHIVSEATPADL